MTRTGFVLSGNGKEMQYKTVHATCTNFKSASRQTHLYLTLGIMEDIKNVHYCSKDPIANLKVRVTLTRISALKRKPKFGEQVGH